MSKLYFEDCPRCGGSGVVYHGNVTLRVQGSEDRYCFKCLGSGKVSFKTSPEQREKNREAARARRLAKWEAERDARLEKERAENDGYTLAELAEVEQKKRKEVQEREWAVSQWLDKIGEKVKFTGTCLFSKTYEGFYGYTTFYIVRTELGDMVKFKTSSQTFDNVSKGSIVEMTGKVKDHESDESRGGQQVTVLERVKCLDTYRIIEEGAA